MLIDAEIKTDNRMCKKAQSINGNQVTPHSGPLPHGKKAFVLNLTLLSHQERVFLEAS